MSEYRDSPIEKRVTELKFIKRPEESQELAFLEEYLRWKADGGPAKFDAQRDAERQVELRKENQARLNRKEWKEMKV
jgi:hypothetical protein